MRYQQDPSQNELFDFYEQILSPIAYRRLTSGWQHLFRTAILQLMPVGRLAEHFNPTIGRPTKELYSIAALLFIMEFRDWTHQEASDAFMFNVDLQYALNLRPENQSLCRRTIERYIQLFREDELAADILNDVTAELVERLELDISKQRLDSTHIESNMAKFGRIKLMATAIKRFLNQIKRHDEGSYNALRHAIRDRYEPSANTLFGWKKLEEDEVDELRQSVAEDLLYLVERYLLTPHTEVIRTFESVPMVRAGPARLNLIMKRPPIPPSSWLARQVELSARQNPIHPMLHHR